MCARATADANRDFLETKFGARRKRAGGRGRFSSHLKKGAWWVGWVGAWVDAKRGVAEEREREREREMRVL